MRDVYGSLRPVGMFPNDDSGLFLQTHAPLSQDPQAWVQFSLIFWVREEERGKSKPEKCFELVQLSAGPTRQGVKKHVAPSSLDGSRAELDHRPLEDVRMYGEFKRSFETVISLIKVPLRKWHWRIFVPWSLWASLQLLLLQTLTPLNQFSRPPSAGADCRAFPSQEARGACTSVALWWLVSLQLHPPASRCLSHTHTWTHMNTPWAPEAPLPLLSFPLCPAKPHFEFGTL